MIRGLLSTVFAAAAAALIGFSVSLATSPDAATSSDGSSAVASRGVGTGLHFTNPPLLAGQDNEFPKGGITARDPNGFDLGDACYGSQLVRYITALGGVEPYLYTSNSVGTTGLKLESTGRVFGLIAPLAGTSIVKFNATLTDPSGATRTGAFRIFAFPATVAGYRFAHNRLSDARVGQDYVTNLEVLNAAPLNTIFSVVPGTVTLSGVVQPTLESLGLRLFDDGTLAGRPVKDGTIGFVARAVSNGARAFNRNGTGPDQQLTIKVEPVVSVQSVLGTVSTVIVGNTARPGNDGFNLTALFNSDGLSSFDLANLPFTVRFAGRTFTSILDGKGNLKRGGPMQVRTNGLLGTLSVTLRKQDFSTLFDQSQLIDGGHIIVPVEIQIGDVYLGTEALEYSIRNRRGRFQLNYILSRSRQVGGLCQVIKVLAKDSRSGGVAFKTDVLVAPPAIVQPQSLLGANDVVVSIGPKFVQDVPLSRGRGRSFGPGIQSFYLHGKVASLQTYGLQGSDTGIGASTGGGGTATFLIGLKITSGGQTFNGEASRRLFSF